MSGSDPLNALFEVSTVRLLIRACPLLFPVCSCVLLVESLMFFSVRCVVSCVFCVCISFSASIRCSYHICTRIRSAAIRHSHGSPYHWQWADNSWVVPPFQGQDYRVRWLIQLSLHLTSLRCSETFKFYLKIIMEITIKLWNILSIISRLIN